jgi:D-tyrosyl-tRNA(Tyr) deacylase
MKAVIQRVERASVTVDGRITGSISRGLAILLGVKAGDTLATARWMAEKCLNLRLFENEKGKFHYSVRDIQGELLVVSQFTVYGDVRRGRRPSFTEAADPELASELYCSFIDILAESGLKIQSGVFAARMEVEIINQGPVTLIVDSEER